MSYFLYIVFVVLSFPLVVGLKRLLRHTIHIKIGDVRFIAATDIHNYLHLMVDLVHHGAQTL